MIGVAEHDVGAGVAHLAPMHALHGARGADRHEGRRPHHAMRRGQPAGARAAVGGEQFEMVGKAHGAAYRVTPASCSTSLSVIFGPQKPLTRPRLCRISSRAMTTSDKPPPKPESLLGLREACARKSSDRIIRTEAPPDEGPGLFYCLNASRKETKVTERSRCCHCRRDRRRRSPNSSPPWTGADFRVGKLKALASARSAGKTLDFRGQKIAIEELNEQLLRRRRHRAVLGRRRHFQEVRADRGEGRRRRGRQFVGLPHGPERAAGDPRDQRRPHPRAQGHHRQSELRGDHRAGAAVADPPARTASSA